MTDLRDTIVDILERWADAVAAAQSGMRESYTHPERAGEVADRILALLPQQPKLEWRDDDLCMGRLCLGYVLELGDWWLGFDMHNKQLFGIDTRQKARAAVEKAVKEALGWPE